MKYIRLFEEFDYTNGNEDIKDEIMNIFRSFKKIFPYMRPDTIDRKVNRGDYVYEDGVVILYTIYNKKQKISDNISGYRGDVMIGELVNKTPGNGKTFEVFDKFVDKMKREGHNRLLGSVRADNFRSINFLKKYGFIEVDKKSWSGGTIPGLVFEYNIKD